MASPSVDQTDEDFFDKLVDEEDADLFASLSVKEVDSLGSLANVGDDICEEIDNDGVSFEGIGLNADVAGVEDGGVGELSESVDPKSGSEFGDRVVNEGGGIKQVQWSAFGGGGGREEDLFSEFGGDLGEDCFGEVAGGVSDSVLGVSSSRDNCSTSCNLVQNEENLQLGSASEQNTENQDQNSVEYWENLYPGWKYDSFSGQWVQLNGPDALVNNEENYNASVQPTCEGDASDPKSDVYHLQQTGPSVNGSVVEENKMGTQSYWNQSTQESTEYPSHMVFDPQYPGWYYDTIALEWRSLDSYNSSVNQVKNLDLNQPMTNSSFATSNNYELNMGRGQVEQVTSYPYQDQVVNWNDFGNTYHQQEMNMAQAQLVSKNESSGSTQNTYFGNGHVSSGQINYSADLGTGAAPPHELALYEERSRGLNSSDGSNGFSGFSSGVAGFHNFASAAQFSQHNNHCDMQYDQQSSVSTLNGPKVLNFSQKTSQSFRQLPHESPYASNEGRSSAGRPPHALVAFGFGGKLLVMKNQSSLYAQSAYVSQDSAEGIINIVNMMEVAMMKSDNSDVGSGTFDYFRTLCQQSLPGPLISGSVGSKELHKWIDERIANCGTSAADYRKGEALKMLFSLLKIACQYYGKLRSAFGADRGLKEHDCPESALANLFTSAKRNGTHCLQNMPSGEQIQATADEVQMLLISGRKMEALQCAQEGHLWGPAMVIAALLGDQFYGETVKQMALHQLVAGSPLRTLCLLLAGQPAEVFSNQSTANPPIGLNATQPVQAGPNYMLDEWEENLAVITANRTKGDELVITHLGDCLWKERSEVIAAHICYLVAEANIESYSEGARVCLIGADHLKYPRTYVSPETIQRTELYEYAKVLGNSQFLLLPFQPYKIIYACMLAEVGKLSDSLKYCQAVLKALKAGRSPEVDAWRNTASSLEERLKLHLQGGYATNLAPAKLVGKLLNFFDNTTHRVVGGLPPSVPSVSHSNGQHNEHDHQSRGPRVSTSQSTMAMSSLMSSGSTEGNSHKLLHSRSISEPDFGRTPRKAESPEKSNSSSPQGNASVSGGPSRFGRFGSQIFQKTVGLVLRSRAERQAKLGEKNKFYYNENLKRWVEEGAETPIEDVPFAPPPTLTTFMNGTAHRDKEVETINGTCEAFQGAYSSVHANGEAEFKSTSSVEKRSGTPPIPPSSNHFSPHGRIGVRSRYVDTFNKGGGYTANSFQSPLPSVPTTKPATSNAKFFIPTPVSGAHETDTTPIPQTYDTTTATTNQNQTSESPQMLMTPPTFRRHPSMEGIPNKGMGGPINGNGLAPPHSRRTLSWSGDGLGDPLDINNYNNINNMGGEARPMGEPFGFPPSSYMPGNVPSMPFMPNCTVMAGDLQEVQL